MIVDIEGYVKSKNISLLHDGNPNYAFIYQIISDHNFNHISLTHICHGTKFYSTNTHQLFVSAQHCMMIDDDVLARSDQFLKLQLKIWNHHSSWFEDLS